VLLAQARLAVRLLREPRVPALTKAVPVAAGLYLISPLDFVPDVLPFLGQIDDLALALIALRVFVHLCPEPTVVHHRQAITQGHPCSPMSATEDVIDAQWRRED